MPGLSDFQVPSYIQPLSQAQAEQLGMERERLQIERDQQMNQARMQQQLMAERDQLMKKRAEDLLQRKLTMAAIQADTLKYKAMPGVDDQEASLRATADHASEIWKDHPEALAAGESAIWNNIKKMQAVKRAKADATALMGTTNPSTGEPYTQEEATMDAYRKNIFDLNEGDRSIGSTLGLAIRGEQTGLYREKSLAEKKREADLNAAAKKEAEAGKNVRQEKRITSQEKRTTAASVARAESAIQKDPLLKDLIEQHQVALRDVRRYEHEQAGWMPGWAGGRNKKMIQDDLAKAKQSAVELHDQIKKREDQIRSRTMTTDEADTEGATGEPAQGDPADNSKDPAGIRSLIAP